MTLGLLAAPAGAWWPEGHTRVTIGAVRALPVEVPAFFRKGAATIGHCSQDPDVAKNRETPNLRDGEEPEHYVDVELLQGRPFPPTRYQYLKLCHELNLDPKSVGLVPYAVTEWTERLSVAFAEHRKWPKNPHIQSKCLIYAGMLAHYATDMCQPLHCTVHHDGRARPDHSSPRTGIHMKVDALIERLDLKPEEIGKGLKIEPVEPLFPGVIRQVEASLKLVDRVYELEAKLPPTEGPINPDPEVVAFTRERARESARFLGSLYLTAWRKSASIKLPPWLVREQNTGSRGR